MFNKKKILSLVLCGVMLMSITSCGKSSGDNGKKSGGKLSIVCTIFPEYDWVREILGDNKDKADITFLLDNSADLHSYQPTAEDIMKISTCDMFIYVGGESDEWVEDALGEAVNKDMKVINLMDVMGDSAKAEEVKEGMQAEEEHSDDKEEEVEYDEHVWLSVRNAQVLCTEIANEICEMDKDNADSYKSNLKAYLDKLDVLDKDFDALFEKAAEKTVVFGDRFPFRYFVDDYGLDYYAAFVGCSAETEASFETIAFLSQKVDELKIDTIYTIENSDGKIAQAIIDNTSSKDQNIKSLDSMQSVTKDDVSGGKTYLGIMQNNYETLKPDFQE